MVTGDGIWTSYDWSREAEARRNDNGVHHADTHPENSRRHSGEQLFNSSYGVAAQDYGIFNDCPDTNMRNLAREAVIFMLVSTVVGAIGFAIWTWKSQPPEEIDLSAGLVPKTNVKLQHADFPTMWVIVDPFQQFGGTFVQPAPALPKEITSHPCVPGSFLWHEKYQWVCVKEESRPNGLPDDLIAEPTNAH